MEREPIRELGEGGIGGVEGDREEGGGRGDQIGLPYRFERKRLSRQESQEKSEVFE